MRLRALAAKSVNRNNPRDGSVSSERRESNLANSHEIGAGARGRIRRKASLVGTYLPSLSREAAVPNLMTRPHCSKETPRKGVTVGLVQLNRCRQPETAKHRRFGTTGVSEASRTSGRRGEYPHRIRVGRRSGLRRRETPSPLLLRSVSCESTPRDEFESHASGSRVLGFVARKCDGAASVLRESAGSPGDSRNREHGYRTQVVGWQRSVCMHPGSALKRALSSAMAVEWLR